MRGPRCRISQRSRLKSSSQPWGLTGSRAPIEGGGWAIGFEEEETGSALWVIEAGEGEQARLRLFGSVKGSGKALDLLVFCVVEERSIELLREMGEPGFALGQLALQEAREIESLAEPALGPRPSRAGL